MSDTPETNQDDELKQQIHDITQTMLVALSEWQAGVPTDYSAIKAKGRKDLFNLIKADRSTNEDRTKLELLLKIDSFRDGTIRGVRAADEYADNLRRELQAKTDHKEVK